MDARKSTGKSPRKESKKFIAKYSQLLASPAKKTARKVLDFDGMNLKNLSAGEEFQCGNDMTFPNEFLDVIRYICFDCGTRYGSFEAKLQHMKLVHYLGASVKICRACLSLSRTPSVHIHKVSFPLFVNAEAEAEAEEAEAEEEEEETAQEE